MKAFNCTHCGYNEASYRSDFYFSRPIKKKNLSMLHVLLRIMYLEICHGPSHRCIKRYVAKLLENINDRICAITSFKNNDSVF